MELKQEHIDTTAIILLIIAIILYLKTGGTSTKLINDLSKSLILSMSFIVIIRSFGIKFVR